jgi:hypothetical protein
MSVEDDLSGYLPHRPYLLSQSRIYMIIGLEGGFQFADHDLSIPSLLAELRLTIH